MSSVREITSTEPKLSRLERRRVGFEVRQAIEDTVRGWPEFNPALMEAYFNSKSPDYVKLNRNNTQITILSERTKPDFGAEIWKLSLVVESEGDKRELLESTICPETNVDSYFSIDNILYVHSRKDGYKGEWYEKIEELENTQSAVDKIKARLKEL